MLVSDAFDLALSARLAETSTERTERACTFASRLPFEPEPVDRQPPSQDGPALISRDSTCWLAATLDCCAARLCKTPRLPRPRHASALHRSPCSCLSRHLSVSCSLARRVSPPHLGREELAANARICDRLHHSNRPAPGLEPGLA